jgi:putative methionine-R-sulfoxide reductase with GAF domain
MVMAEIENRLARTLGDLAVEMQAQKGSADTLHAILASATHVVSGARWAGISLINGKRVTAEASTDPIVGKLDELQNELGDGPCLTALRDQHTVHIADMSTETRWPQFARQARELGAHSQLSFHLFVRSDNLGALNLFGAEPDAFTEESIEAGTILAQHAAVAMTGATAEAQFNFALASRDIIGQAKGLLMEHHGLTGVQAFAMLTRASQDTQMKLVDVARSLVAEHESGEHVPEPEITQR